MIIRREGRKRLRAKKITMLLEEKQDMGSIVNERKERNGGNR